jgi:hypothetical protein
MAKKILALGCNLRQVVALIQINYYGSRITPATADRSYGGIEAIGAAGDQDDLCASLG